MRPAALALDLANLRECAAPLFRLDEDDATPLVPWLTITKEGKVRAGFEVPAGAFRTPLPWDVEGSVLADFLESSEGEKLLLYACAWFDRPETILSRELIERIHALPRLKVERARDWVADLPALVIWPAGMDLLDAAELLESRASEEGFLLFGNVPLAIMDRICQLNDVRADVPAFIIRGKA